jgi:uncharacterized protein YggE
VDQEIVVRGEASARVLPDRATVLVVVDGDGGTRDDAYAAAVEPARAVDEVIERFADAIARSFTTALAVQPLTRYRKGESKRTGWRATRTSTIEVERLDELGELAAALATAGAALHGPGWHIDRTNPAYDQLRRAAAEDARRRGEAYASALGLELDAVRWVTEPGMRHNVDGPLHMARAALAGGAARGGDDVIEVVPEEIEVNVAVEVGFSFIVAAGTGNPKPA